MPFGRSRHRHPGVAHLYRLSRPPGEPSAPLVTETRPLLRWAGHGLAPSQQERSRLRLLGWALAAVALWAMAAPWAGRPVGFIRNARLPLEVSGHVLPGGLGLAMAVLWLRRGPVKAYAAWTLVAGIWMTGNHLPLLVSAPRHPAVLFHTLPAVGLLALGIVMVLQVPQQAAGEVGFVNPSREGE